MELGMKDYFMVLLRKWWLIGTIVAVACGITAMYHYNFAKPVYEADSKLIVTNSNQNLINIRPDMNEINSNIMLIESYKEIVATPAIMEKVVAKYPDIRMGVNDLIANIRVDSSKGSQVMSISIRDSSLSQAVLVVNAVADVFKQEIPKIMSVDNITILSKAKASDHSTPVSYGLVMKLIIATVLSLFASIGLVFLLDYLDDSMKSDHDIENYLGLPTLTNIVKIKSTKMKRTSEATNKKIVGESIHVGINQQV